MTFGLTGNPARKPEDAPRTSARVEHAQSDPGNGRPSDRNLAPLRGMSGRPRITGKPEAWRPVCPFHPDVAAFHCWDVAEIVTLMHHRYCQEDQ